MTDEELDRFDEGFEDIIKAMCNLDEVLGRLNTLNEELAEATFGERWKTELYWQDDLSVMPPEFSNEVEPIVARRIRDARCRLKNVVDGLVFARVELEKVKNIRAGDKDKVEEETEFLRRFIKKYNIQPSFTYSKPKEYDRFQMRLSDAPIGQKED